MLRAARAPSAGLSPCPSPRDARAGSFLLECLRRLWKPKCKASRLSQWWTQLETWPARAGRGAHTPCRRASSLAVVMLRLIDDLRFPMCALRAVPHLCASVAAGQGQAQAHVQVAGCSRRGTAHRDCGVRVERKAAGAAAKEPDERRLLLGRVPLVWLHCACGSLVSLLREGTKLWYGDAVTPCAVCRVFAPCAVCSRRVPCVQARHHEQCPEKETCVERLCRYNLKFRFPD